MGELMIQFDKLLETLKEKDAEIERLRELLVRCQPQIEAGYGHGRIDRELILDLKKEMGDE